MQPSIRTAVWNPGLTSAKSIHLTFSSLPGTLRVELQADTARTHRTTGRAQEVRSHQSRTGCEEGAGPGTQATGQGETCTRNLTCGTPAHTRRSKKSMFCLKLKQDPGFHNRTFNTDITWPTTRKIATCKGRDGHQPKHWNY